MIKDDIQLIRRVLAGDDEAFTALVRKHQKSVHALAWRRVGDFHFAEEITQDAFLRAYRGLPKLKDPGQFSGWLYVITNRLCNDWLQENKTTITLLEDTPVVEVQRTAYERYVSEQNEKKGRAHREELVRKLLAELPESERTVMTLYYLGEMTAKEIGNFLGVSVNTITSRLQRARQRLQQHEELLVQEMLGGIRLPESLTQNIIRKVADTELIPSPTGKPFLPWVAFGVASVLVMLLLSASNQYLVRFQKPYSFQAQSEPTIEIIDTPITLNIDSKPAVRNQAGKVVIASETSGIGLRASEEFLVPNTQENSMRPSTSRWTQASGPQGSPVFEIFATSEGTVYAATPASIYRLTAEATAWTPINLESPVRGFGMPITEHGETLYIVYPNQVLTSIDNGETWNALSSRPKGHAVGLIIMDESQENSSQSLISMYLALRDNGIFHSIDGGKQWTPLNNGLSGKRIYAVAAIGNTVFAGTNEGLYCLNSDVWEQLPVDVSKAVHSLAIMGNNLYVGMGSDPFILRPPQAGGKYPAQIVSKDNVSSWKVYYSTNLGRSWTEITPKDESSIMSAPRSVKILVSDKALLVLDGTHSFRSNDGGLTWTNLGLDKDSVKQNIFPVVAVDENTFFRAGEFGIHRTTNSGTSWHPFIDGIIGTRTQDVAVLNGRLYVHTGMDIFQSTDSGESWKSVRIDANKQTFGPIEQETSHINFSYNSKIASADEGLYGIIPEKYNLHIFRLSTDGNVFIPLQEIPALKEETLSTELWRAIAEAEQIYLPDDMEKDAQLTKALRHIATFAKVGGFAVSDEAFYIECRRQLFRWRPDDSEWTNTGLIDLGKQSDTDLRKGFKLAVSGETIYVGKREGNLFQSLDEGTSWKDLTPTLPIRFKRFNEIVFAGSTAYVATDKGVLASQNGEPWRVLTDGTRRRIVVDRLAVNGATVYGAGDEGVYHLDTRGRWKQISPSVPDRVISLVINNNRLYIATQQRGMFHISLAEEDYSLSRR